MTRPWKTVDEVPTAEGQLKLLQRGPGDFMITIDGRVLMVSAANRSEKELARLAMKEISDRKTPRVLIGGLGLGYTLKAALEHLPAKASVDVAELTEQVVSWCRGPLAELTDDALADPRVAVKVEDVTRLISRAKGDKSKKYDAIVLDLYEGPNEANRETNDHLYGSAALAQSHTALKKNGILAVWGEDPDPHYEKRLVSAGFEFRRVRPDGGARRHVVYLAHPRPIKGSAHRPNPRKKKRR